MMASGNSRHFKRNDFMRKFILLMILIFCIFSSCSKADNQNQIYFNVFSVDTLGADTIQNKNIIAYLFDADTTTSFFESYENAADGIMTLKSNKSKIKAKYKSIQLEKYIEFPITINRLLVGVACDTLKKIYYYRNIVTDINIENIYIELIMQPYLFKPDIVNLVNQKSWIGQN